MELLVVVLILAVLAVPVLLIGLWVYAASLSTRLSATQGRLVDAERRHGRQLDGLAGRLRALEARLAGAVEAKAEPRVSEAVEAAEAAEAVSDEPATPDSTLSLLRRSAEQRAAREAEAESDDAEAKRGADIPVCPAAAPEDEADMPAEKPVEKIESTAAHTPVPDEGPPRDAEPGLRPVADRHVRPTEKVGRESVPAQTVPTEVGTAAGSPVRAARNASLNFEQLLGGKVFVWIGAVALVLTGAFLLKYGYENYYIAPSLRVMAAGVFGLALIGVAEWLRPRNGGRYMGIAQAACGAGVAVLFGTVYAGHSLYPLITDVPAFLLLAAVTAGAVLLSLRHGPLVALLGLFGGFALPPLLKDQLPAQEGMVVYLLAIELGVLAVTRKRGWVGISALTLLGAVGWSLGYVLFGGETDHTFTGLLVMGTAVVFVLNTTFAQGRKDTGDEAVLRQALWLSLGAVASGVALLGLLVVYGGYSGQDMAMLGLMAAGTLVLSRIDVRYMLLAWVSFGLGAVVVLGAGGSAWWSRGDDLSILTRGALGFGLLFGLGGYAAQWWPTRRKGFALMSALAGPVFLAVAVVGGGWLLGYRGVWWPWGVGVGMAYALAAAPLVWRGLPAREAAAGRGGRLADLWPASAYALSCVVLLTAAATFELFHPWLAVTWAGLGAAAGYVGWRLRMVVLTYASAALAGMSAFALVVPGPFIIDIHGTVVFNTLLPVYGLTVLAFALAGWSAHRAGRAGVSRPLQALAVGAGAVLLAVLVRQGFQPADFNAPAAGLYEWPTYAVALLSLSIALLFAAKRWGLETVEFSATAVGLVGVGLAVVGPVVVGSPLLYDAAGGSLVFGLVYLYGVPAVLTLVLARWMDRLDIPEFARALRAVAVGLTAVFAVFQVRNGFHFTDLDADAVGLYEWPTYAVVLLALSWGLLNAGRRWAGVSAKWSAALVGLAGVAVVMVGPVLAGNPLGYEASGVSLVFGLIYLYLVPAALIVPLARWIDRLDEPILARGLRIVAVGLAAVFGLLQVRNGFHFTDLYAEAMGFYERATYGLALFALAWLLRGAARWAGSRFLDGASWAVASAAMMLAVAAVVLVGSPLADPSVQTGRWLAWAMVFTYLAPAAAGWLFAMRRVEQPLYTTLARLMRGGSVLLVTVFVALQVRNGFHPDTLRSGAIGLFEWATYGLVWMLLGAGLRWAGRLRGDRDLAHAGRWIALVGLALSLVGTVLVRNPLWTAVSVGATPVVNGLWYLYVPPIVALAVIAYRLRATRRMPEARVAGGGAIALGFMLLSLLVRQGFSADGTLVLANTTVDAEWYAYSLAWVVLGIGLLIGGVATRLDTLRYGSLAVMLVAVAKVFALDAAGLEDLLRVFSFLGLGVTLLLLGYTYQRFVFRRPKAERTLTESTAT